jgi:hypothetical protein
MSMIVLEVLYWEGGEPGLVEELLVFRIIVELLHVKPRRAIIPIYDALFCRYMLLDILAPIKALLVVEKRCLEFLTVGKVTEHRPAFERLVWRRLVKQYYSASPGDGTLVIKITGHADEVLI